jgi:hypothetical protein
VRYHFAFLLAALLLACGAAPLSAFAQKQDRLYLDAVMQPTGRKNAVYYRVSTGTDDGGHVGRTYTMDGVLKAEGVYADPELTVEHGRFTFYHTNGKVESTGTYRHGLKCGVWERYDRWGRELAEKVYDPGYLDTVLYTRAQQMPSFQDGGEQGLVRYLRNQLNTGGDKQFKGRATATVVVEKDGSISNVQVLERLGPDVDEELVDALRNSGPWTPGMERGRPVRVQMKVPVEL